MDLWDEVAPDWRDVLSKLDSAQNMCYVLIVAPEMGALVVYDRFVEWCSSVKSE